MKPSQTSAPSSALPPAPGTATLEAAGPVQRRVRLEVPEHVRLDYDLADLGSRFAAFLADLALLGATLAVFLLAASRFAAGPGLLEALGRAAAIIVLFAATWGYFAGFEALSDGRTPGKRLLGLRTLHAGGQPLTARGAIIRNLVRVVDLQPALTGAVGGLAMMASGRTQRLGDLAADTIVVRDDGWGRPPWEHAPKAGGRGRPRLGEEQFALLSNYMRRRGDLAPAVRARLVVALVEAMRTVVPPDRTARPGGGEDYLESLYREESGRRGGEAEGWKRQAAALARRRGKAWRAYGGLVARARKRGLTRLADDEVRRFGRLYRGMTADLARARAYRAPASLLYALEKWTGTGHNLLYQAERRFGFSAGRWIGVVLPRAVRAQAGGVGLAALILFGSGMGTYAAVRADPGLARYIVPAAMFSRAENTPQGDATAAYVDVQASGMPVLASGVITNNLTVSFMVFAGGMLAGTATGLVLAINGVFLGAVFALYANAGVFAVLLAFVAPHGVLELAAICISGGAGFGLARAILLPGRRSRRRVLAEQARRSLSTLGCAALLLLLAGLVEGFYSPSGLPPEAKFLFGGASAVGLALYFGMAGRGGGQAAGATGARAP